MGDKRAKVLGTQDRDTHEFGDPPAPLKKGEEVTFTGKWPLESCLDNDREIFTFTLANGAKVTGTLISFTVDCKGCPRIRIRLMPL